MNLETFLSLVALPTFFAFLVIGIWHGAGWQFAMTSDGVLTVTTPSGVIRVTRPPGMDDPADRSAPWQPDPEPAPF